MTGPPNMFKSQN